MGYEIPGFFEGVDHSLIQRTLFRSGHVLLKLLHARHANNDSISKITLETWVGENYSKQELHSWMSVDVLRFVFVEDLLHLFKKKKKKEEEEENLGE